MPPRRLHEEAVPRLGVGEGAPRVAEELALEELLGHRGAVDGDEGSLRARAARVERPRDELLAGPALAGDEHRRVGARDASIESKALTISDEPPTISSKRWLFVDAVPERWTSARGSRAPGRRARASRELVHFERLGDEVVGPGADAAIAVSTLPKAVMTMTGISLSMSPTRAQSSAPDTPCIWKSVRTTSTSPSPVSMRAIASSGDCSKRHLKVAFREFRFEDGAEVSVVIDDQDVLRHREPPTRLALKA